MLYGGYVILMSRVKDIRLKVIPSNVANDFIKKNHYSGKVVPNSTLHFGAFLDDVLHGVMSYGPSINKKGTINLVDGTKWNGFIELNRMAFDEHLPKYSESRCIAISMRLLKKNAPHIKWVISFADGTQCGDGTIYRASGFKLVGIAKSGQVFNFNNEIVHGKILWDKCLVKGWTVSDSCMKKLRDNGHKIERLEGYQLKYIYFIDKSMEKDLTKPILPFSKIKEMGASMYRGKKICDSGVKRSTASFQDVGGGAIPTESLQLERQYA